MTNVAVRLTFALTTQCVCRLVNRPVEQMDCSAFCQIRLPVSFGDSVISRCRTAFRPLILSFTGSLAARVWLAVALLRRRPSRG